MDVETESVTYGAALGQLILKKRRALGLTQTQLAEDALGKASKARRIHELESGSVARPHPKTIDPIINVLKITDAELEACAEAVGHGPDVELDRAYREARNLIEAMARQFEHAKPDASLSELEDYLRAKAHEWRQLRDRIHAVETIDQKREELRESASAALAAGDFDRVDALLAEAEETQQQDRTLQEIERQAQIRITRGDACLFREDADAAVAFYSSAAHFFDPFEPQRAADLLSYLGGRVYEMSRRSLTPQFSIACRLLDELVNHPTVQENPVELGIANYRRGLLYRNEAVGPAGEHVQESLLRQALSFDRKAVELIDGTEVQDIAVSARISLGICLIEMAKIEPEAAHLEEALSTMRSAHLIAQDVAPALRATASNNLGAVYLAKRRRADGEEASECLRLAQAAFRRAVEEAEEHADMDIWGGAHLNCGRVLVEQARGTEADRKRFLFTCALAHYHAAIETFPATLFPQRFGEANLELASILESLSLITEAPISAAYFARSLNTYAAAATVFTRNRHPRHWAKIHMLVGAGFADRAATTDDEDEQQGLIDQAKSCFAGAAEVFASTGDEEHAAACEEAAANLENRVGV
jgi:tetratricopeptide (TPR) repeat protein